MSCETKSLLNLSIELNNINSKQHSSMGGVGEGGA